MNMIHDCKDTSHNIPFETLDIYIKDESAYV